MIEPTAIPKSGDYDKSHVEPYYVRRFKNDIVDADVRANFQERKVIKVPVQLSNAEVDFLEYQQDLKFKAIDAVSKGDPKDDFLFSIGIFKAFLSSPTAALESVKRRIEKVTAKNKADNIYEDNLEILENLKTKLERIINSKSDTKYAKLKNTLIELGWSGKKHDDRYVIFAERIDTLEYLRDQLKMDLAESIIYRNGITKIDYFLMRNTFFSF